MYLVVFLVTHSKQVRREARKNSMLAMGHHQGRPYLGLTSLLAI